MAGIDEPDDLQWPKERCKRLKIAENALCNRFKPLIKVEGRVNNGKFAVKAVKAKSTESKEQGDFDEEGRMVVADDKEDDARKFPCPECDFVFLRKVFTICIF